MSTLAEDDSSSGALKTPHKQSKGPRRYAYDVLAKALDAQNQFSPLARVHALKFYDLARAPDSLFRVGQDLVDQFVRNRDFDGALNMMETIVLPQLRQWKIADYLISVRSQYAVVLAYCERYSDAEAEMERLEPYKSGLPPLAQGELENQRKLIARLQAFGPPPKWVPPPGLLEGLADHFAKTKQMRQTPARESKRKIGRNERCSCGSGKKFKHCHGRAN
ncbi:SEC-C metal-binding domain-containing protein [Bradyrhizobium sp. CCBAU 53421]|uniref:SEC-C metal-binding domain-containing protein n=1 Tax=Bradyrhizobium sp. CCBAU 53421 TaxID=1325120 RepID=UPI001AEE8CDE|nr:SEC-C metal-binding domain-containing protein [Bradyrhizobium sp. CCBAU 53421]